MTARMSAPAIERLLAGSRALFGRSRPPARVRDGRLGTTTPATPRGGLCRQGARFRVAVVCHAEPGADRAAELLDIALSSDECGVGGGSLSRPLHVSELSGYLRAEADRLDVRSLVQRVADENAAYMRACELWAPGVASTWLASPNAHLGGACPIDMIKLHDVEAVLAALETEQDGAFG